VKLTSNGENATYDEMTEYLRRKPKHLRYTDKSEYSLEDLMHLVEDSSRRYTAEIVKYKFVDFVCLFRLLNNVSSKLKLMQKNGCGFDAAWSQNLVALTKCAKVCAH